MNASQANAVRLIVSAVLDSIKAAGSVGAPGGIIYAALMSQGCSFSQYTSLMGSIERSGFVTRDGDCYHLTDAGRTFQA